MRIPWIGAALSVLVLIAPGCNGDDTQAEGQEGDESMPETGDGDGEQVDPGAKLPARRLSHFEYRNTLRDLFPHIELPELINRGILGESPKH